MDLLAVAPDQPQASALADDLLAAGLADDVLALSQERWRHPPRSAVTPRVEAWLRPQTSLQPFPAPARRGAGELAVDTAPLDGLHLRQLSRMGSESRYPQEEEAPIDRFDANDSAPCPGDCRRRGALCWRPAGRLRVQSRSSSWLITSQTTLANTVLMSFNPKRPLSLALSMPKPPLVGTARLLKRL